MTCPAPFSSSKIVLTAKDNDMSNITIRIQWQYGVERIDFNPSSPTKNGAVIETEEYWSADDIFLKYKVKVEYSKKLNGDHCLQLDYHPTRNKILAEKYSAISWGTSTIRLQSDLSMATLEWKYHPRFPVQGNQRKPAKSPTCTVLSGDDVRVMDVEILSRIKRNQTEFKKKLSREGAYCAISGESTAEVLQAAHILDVRNGGIDEPENGILLRSDLHLLFDQGYLVIQKNGKIKVSKSVSENYREELRSAKLDDRVFKRVSVFLGRRKKIHINH
jgi:hypothetical protein